MMRFQICSPNLPFSSSQLEFWRVINPWGGGIKTSSVIKCFHSSHTSHFIAKCWKKTNGIVYCCTKGTHSFSVKAGPLHSESNGRTDVGPVLCNSLAARRVPLSRQADPGCALFLPLRTNAHQLASHSQGAGAHCQQHGSVSDVQCWYRFRLEFRIRLQVTLPAKDCAEPRLLLRITGKLRHEGIQVSGWSGAGWVRDSEHFHRPVCLSEWMQNHGSYQTRHAFIVTGVHSRRWQTFSEKG